MTERDELETQLQAAQQKTLGLWSAFRVSQVDTTRQFLSEQARITVIEQDRATQSVDLPTLRTEVNATIDGIATSVDHYLAHVDNETIYAGWSSATDATNWERLFHPFADLFIRHGYAPRDHSLSPLRTAQDWVFYNRNPAGSAREYFRASRRTVPIATEAHDRYKGGVAQIAGTVRALQQHDTAARRSSIADAWDN